MDKKSVCKYSSKCNGCQLLNLSYSEQLAFKQKKVEKLLVKFGKVEEIIPAQNPFGYRNKVTFAFDTTKSGEYISGIYNSAKDSVVSVKNCRLDNALADKIANSVFKLIKSFKIKPYNKRNGSGILRFVTIRTAQKTGQVLVLLVTAKPEFPKKRDFIKALTNENPEITTVVHGVNCNEKSIFTDYIKEVLYGDGYIIDELCDKKFKIGADTFYQINHTQTEKLYKKAIELANPKKNEKILDAYCGIGTITLSAADFVKEAVGFEINPLSVENAKENIKLNKTENVRVFNCDAAKFTAKDKFDTVFLDPPRAGCSLSFIRTLLKISPKKIVYISCNPETQRRDLEQITRKGYKVECIQPVDMFPNTNHVESVTLMTRNK